MTGMRDGVATPIELALRRPLVIFGLLAVLIVAPVALLALLFWLVPPALAWTQAVLGSQTGFSIFVMVLTLLIIIHGAAGCIWLERKISAWIQDRHGPNRVGWRGLLQPVADGLKFLLKEDIIPANVDKPVFLLAPALSFAVSLLGFAIIPWAGRVHLPWMPAGQTVSSQVAELDVGVLYFVSIGALSVYGVVLAGWASNNKYSFYGGMRATAQMLSYEVPLGLGLLCVLLVSGTLRLEEIIDQQARTGIWNIVLQPIPFLLVLISAFAETNRAPFDLAEAEQELVGGYHTEYSALKFGLFFLAEYAHMITNSAIMVALFFGGWHLWGLPGVENTSWWAALIKFTVFWAKVGLFIGFYMLIRWTLPRFRFDQLMRLAWRSLVPLGMVMVVAAGGLVALGWKVDAAQSTGRNLVNSLVSLAVNVLLLVVALYVAAHARTPVTGRQHDLPEVEVVAGHRPQPA